jgi:hypothetical protein
MKAAFLLLLLAALLLLAGASHATAPQSAPTITSPTHKAGVPSNASIADFSWIAVGADLRFLHSLTLNATSEPADADNATTDTTVQLLLPEIGQWYFHVVALNADGRSPTGHYGPVSRNLTLQQQCAAAFQSQDSQGGPPNEAALADCIAAAQNKVAPEMILALFMGFLAKFGSATLKRG